MFVQELGVVLRSMGQNPSEQELKEMISEMDEDNSGTVDFEEFVILMKKKTEDAEGNDDIEEAFRIFDSKNDGWDLFAFAKPIYFCRVICAEELMNVMIRLGNPRTEEEIKVILSSNQTNNNVPFYSFFI